MDDRHAAFLLNEKGRRLPLSPERKSSSSSPTCKVWDAVDEAVNRLGFVLVTLAHRAVVIELCPHKVHPRAVQQASRIVVRGAAECVLLARAGDTWRRSKYEFFPSTRAAAEALLEVTRSAEKRLAFEERVRAQTPGGCAPYLFEGATPPPWQPGRADATPSLAATPARHPVEPAGGLCTGTRYRVGYEARP
jgi:hypothetical protein